MGELIPETIPIFVGSEDAQISASDFPTNGGKLQKLFQWLKSGGVDAKEVKSLLDRIKSEVLENLKPGHIEPSYYVFLRELAKRLV